MLYISPSLMGQLNGHHLSSYLEKTVLMVKALFVSLEGKGGE